MKASEVGLYHGSLTKLQAISLISELYTIGCDIHFIMITEEFSCKFRSFYKVADEEQLKHLLKDLEFIDDPELVDATLEDYDGLVPFSDCVEFKKPGEYRLQILF